VSVVDMISNIIELYGELENLKNKLMESQHEISSIKSFTPRTFYYIANLLKSLIDEWELSGLKTVYLDFNNDLQRNMNYIRTSFRNLTTYYYKIIDGEPNKELVSEIKLTITDIVESIMDIQRIINTFDNDFIFSNILIREQFDDLLSAFQSLIHTITPAVKDSNEIIALPDIYREDIVDFVNRLMQFARHFGINIEPNIFAVLYEPLFEKQTKMEYDNKLTAFEHFIYSVMTQIRERLN
jgi:hypothetical protein